MTHGQFCKTPKGNGTTLRRIYNPQGEGVCSSPEGEGVCSSPEGEGPLGNRLWKPSLRESQTQADLHCSASSSGSYPISSRELEISQKRQVLLETP